MTPKELCQKFIERANAQGMKGKARDRAALEFVCGAATVNERFVGLAFMISVRGYTELVEVATQPERETKAA